MSGSPSHVRSSVVYITDEESAIVRRFIARAGSIDAAWRRLGTSEAVILAARDRGRMKHSTRDRLLAGIAREERQP